MGSMNQMTGRATRALAVAGVLVAVGAAAGCGSSSSNSSSSSGSSGGTSTGSKASGSGLQGKKVFFLGCGSAVPYCAAQNKTVKADLAGTGAQLNLLESNYDPAVQSQQINQALSQKADIIALVPAAQAPLRPVLLKAKAAKVPVLLLFNAPEAGMQPMFTSWIGQDDAAEAKDSAQQMIEGLKKVGQNSGNILMVAGAPGGATTLRTQAFTEAIKGSPYKLADQANGQWDPVKATTVAQQLFAKWKSKGFVGVYGMSGAMAAAVVQAAKQSNLKTGVDSKGLIITGNNCDPTSIKAIQSGDMYADIKQSPIDDAHLATEAVKQYFEKGSLPPRITSHTPVINSTTVGQYAQACTF
jgi:simple sugar transport system substrate-binding protein